MTTLHTANATRWLSFYNASGETIPSYGVFSIPLDTETPTNEREKLRLVGKMYNPTDPGDDPSTYLAFGGRYERIFAINGRTPVEAGKFGRCTFAFDGPAWARWKTSEDTTIPEDRLDLTQITQVTAYPVQVGPYPGAFGMSATGFGFRVIRVPDSNDERILVQQIPPEVPFKVKVISQWITSLGDQNAGGTNAPYTWCVGQPINGMEQFINAGVSGSLTAGSPKYKACLAILATEDTEPVIDGRIITVQFRRGQFYVLSGGSNYFPNCYVVSGSTSGSSAEVDLSYGLGATIGAGDQTAYTVSAYPSDPSLSIPTGTQCDVIYSVADANFYIVGVHCP